MTGKYNIKAVTENSGNSNQNEQMTEEYNIEWKEKVCNHSSFVFDSVHSGITPEIAAALVCETPNKFYSFLDDEILETIAEQTNLYHSRSYSLPRMETNNQISLNYFFDYLVTWV